MSPDLPGAPADPVSTGILHLNEDAFRDGWITNLTNAAASAASTGSWPLHRLMFLAAGTVSLTDVNLAYGRARKFLL